MGKFKPVIFGQIHAAGDTNARGEVSAEPHGDCACRDLGQSRRHDDLGRGYGSGEPRGQGKEAAAGLEGLALSFLFESECVEGDKLTC
jgi:hypothetical protein